jgi:hypothetical protein
MVATTQWNLYDDELETLVTKLDYHARFLTSAAYAIQTKVPDSNGPAHHNPVEPTHRPWKGSWHRIA